MDTREMKKHIIKIIVWGLLTIPIFVSAAFGGTWATMSSGTGQHLYAVWGTSYDNVYAVGAAGTIIHYDGSAWTKLSVSGVSATLYGIWGSAANNIYAVGPGTVAHFDGSSWTNTNNAPTSQTLYAVWGTDANNIYAVGAAGLIYRFDGSSWEFQSSNSGQNLNWVWGTASNNVYSVGALGIILRHNGTSWSTEVSTSGSENTLEGMWGSSSSNIYAVGSSGRIVHYNGSAWSTISSETGNQLYSVWGESASSIYAVGALGTVLYYDGSSWSVTNSTAGTSNTLEGVWGSNNVVYAVGELGRVIILDNVVANTAPTASFTLSSSSIVPNEQVTFDASGTSDQEESNAVLIFSWDFGDGNTTTGTPVTHTFTSEGTFNVILTVADSQGLSGTQTKSVSAAVPVPLFGITGFALLFLSIPFAYTRKNMINNIGFKT